ncbi:MULTISPECIES: hypothetical protein [Acinetobacter calcoaceticus/baumannii complex]|uniref:hypothetical protein n=1 Tax=Acinetobacter calcoaceticus/baumannii complex TaxID=909768 RepID=UPI00095169EF|nr:MULTISPECIES: hypothetical protein [Acinetobacter calcoaceticus/baumannii complex]KAA8926495.1 hypothetical protein DLI70_15885 [Acinetobacter baumannii]KAA8945791.1 hypothetical protein DLI72_15715 [Acinetobacter baumannii]KAA8951651.1 hypothetical protein DLI73_06230 [Acinetobacter baumannii]MBQ4975499.1 hypothetical protein [Acinetobacter baumannii]MBY5194479.1 hypothetical protein [Acinetobacter baumannii]
MSHKTIKPDLDLVFARIAIFGMLASLFAVSYVNGHPSWLTWVVMLLGVFSIFEAAIKADEDALAANGLAKIIISHSGKLASQRDEYKFVAESLDDLYVRECKKTNELKKSIQGNQGRIAELERLNQVKVQTILDLHQEIKELKASHHGEMIGHEVHLKKIKQERNELQTLYTQQGINMLKMQKRVDKAIRFLVEAELYQSEPNIDLAVKALKGEGQ